MISRKTVLTVALAVAVLGAVSGALIGYSFSPYQPPAHAAWKEVFEAPSHLSRGVDSIVLAKVVSVAPGRTAQSADGQDLLPYQVYELEVVRGVKGAQTGERIFVERAGGVGANGQRIVINVDGGEYELGATYVLFLNRGEGDTFYQVNHQGRYLVAENKMFGVDPSDPVVSFFEGRPVSEGLGLVRGYLREKPMAN